MDPETNPAAWFFHRNTIIPFYQAVDQPAAAGVAPFKEYLGAPLLPLPAPGALEISLGAAIQERLSCRRFQALPLQLAELATLLYAGYGIQQRVLLGEHEMLVRPVPSGGGLYPLEIYILVRHVAGLEPGIYHYAVLNHALARLDHPPLTAARLTELFLGQGYVAEAALTIVLTAIPARLLGKYGDRGYRLLLLEAGHVGQNLNLASTALACASINLGGFFDLELGALLGLDNDQEIPIYAIAIGKPQPLDAAGLRLP